MRPLILVPAIAVCLAAHPAPAALEWRATTIDIEAGPLDEKAEGVFAFTNAGAGTVTISDVSSSCGCTVPTLEKRVYAPGERGEIHAVYTFNGNVGHQTKTITVTTDEAGTTDYALVLQVNIPQLFDVSPHFVTWKRGDAPEPHTISIRVLRPELAAPVSVESQNNRVRATLEKAADAPDLYRVVITPRDTETTVQASIVVKTNFPASDPRTITVYGLVR